jgi:hypothetical protein
MQWKWFPLLTEHTKAGQTCSMHTEVLPLNLTNALCQVTIIYMFFISPRVPQVKIHSTGSELVSDAKMPCLYCHQMNSINNAQELN